MMFIDTHAHLYDERFAEDLPAVITRAEEAGVRQIISMGDTMEASARAVADAEKYPALYAAVGIHPENAAPLSDADRAQLLAWARHPKVVAIGEIGLDYYWEKDNDRRDAQRQCFIHQLDLARQLGLPVCIHDREAHGDLLAILKTEGRENTGVIHCFSGSWETARELLRLGWYLGIDGPVTYKNAAKLPDIVRRLPIDRILLETDSPYLAPVPHRGKRNEPAFVQSTAEFVANLRGIPLATLAEQTTANARRLYTLPEA